MLETELRKVIREETSVAARETLASFETKVQENIALLRRAQDQMDGLIPGDNAPPASQHPVGTRRVDHCFIADRRLDCVRIAIGRASIGSTLGDVLADAAKLAAFVLDGQIGK